MLDPRNDSVFRDLARKVIDDKNTLLYYDRLHVLYQALANIKGTTPTIVEAGVYKGGSKLFLGFSSAKVFHRRYKNVFN